MSLWNCTTTLNIHDWLIKLQLWLRLVDLNYNCECDWLIELSDKKLSHNKLKVIQEFYEDLYSSEISKSQEQFDLFTRNLIFPKLSDEDREQIEGPLTLDECKRVLELFQENKSPGEDGFTVEFYKYFFDSVGSYLSWKA